MKKLSIILIIFLLTAAGCTSFDHKDKSLEEGMSGADRYLVAGTGTPDWEKTKKEERRKQSYLRAVNSAKDKVKSYFREMCRKAVPEHCGRLLKAKPYCDERRWEVSNWLDFLNNKVDSGRVVQVKYDDKDNCRVIYEFRVINLKKRARECR